jgi:hypothetical protein
MNVSFKEPRSVETTVESGLSGRAKSSHGGEDGRSSRAVVIGRAVFVASLFAVAALLGFLAHHYLHQAEEKLARLQYDSAANHAVNSLQRIARNKLYGASALAKVVANAVPNVEDWPLIHVPGFHEIANDIVPTSLVGGLSVAPIVTPDQVAAFETFAYETFAQQFPGEDVALSDFGTGIWDRDCNSDFEDGKCHDTTGDVDFDSPFQILTPKFLHSRGNHKLIMLNVHHEVVKGSVVDAGITCAMERAQMENPQDHHCQAVSEMVFSSKSGAGAFVVTPIYPDGLTVRPLLRALPHPRWSIVSGRLTFVLTVGRIHRLPALSSPSSTGMNSLRPYLMPIRREWTLFSPLTVMPIRTPSFMVKSSRLA